MYLSRGEPLGAHREAFKHILRARGSVQLLSSRSFALWRIAHHRLRARQIVLRQPPDEDQMRWAEMLNTDVPAFHISSDILRMSILCSKAREISEQSRNSEQDNLNQAQDLARQILDFLTSVRDWISDLNEDWCPNTVNADRIRPPQEFAVSRALPPPNQSTPHIMKDQNIWLTYMWNCRPRVLVKRSSQG